MSRSTIIGKVFGVKSSHNRATYIAFYKGLMCFTKFNVVVIQVSVFNNIGIVDRFKVFFFLFSFDFLIYISIKVNVWFIEYINVFIALSVWNLSIYLYMYAMSHQLEMEVLHRLWSLIINFWQIRKPPTKNSCSKYVQFPRYYLPNLIWFNSVSQYFSNYIFKIVWHWHC